MKKILCVVLAIVMLASVAAISVSANVTYGDETLISVKDAVAAYEASAGEACPTNRYYFLMPDGDNGPVGDSEHEGEKASSWYNDFTESAGIYWWGELPITGDSNGWVGFLPEKGDAPNVFYADVPQFVKTLIWNNCVDGGMDDTLDIYFCAAQTVNIGCEYYDPEESPLYPDGTDSFDNMIYVIDPDLISVNEYSLKQTCGGEWYYYYGNGCYGTVKGGEADVEANCLNPDHHHGAPEYLLGDTDSDGQVTVLDATQIQKYKAQMSTLTETELLAADTDRDGFVTVMDATRIQKFKAQIIPEL